MQRPVPLLLFAAVMLVGCATTQNPAQKTTPGPLPKKIVHSSARAPAPRMQAQATPARPAPLPIPLPDAALLKRQPAPDCELKTQPAGEPGEVRLKTLDYERQCYKEVEGVVRARLDTLQDAVGETIKAVKGGGK